MPERTDKRSDVLLLTCEHGGNHVPAAYRPLFAGADRLLGTHRGFDLGAREAARHLQRRFGAPLICATVTRLLVDLNRSMGHPALFSEFSRGLSCTERVRLLERYYLPYRSLVTAWIGTRIAGGQRVVHVAVHSFTPVLQGVVRTADVGLLYDPAREREARFCREWQRRILAGAGSWRVRRNYPYRGAADGLITTLRRRFAATRYLGLEIELNQGVLRNARTRAALLHDLAAAAPWGGQARRPSG